MSIDPALGQRISQSVTSDVADRVLPELGSFTRAVAASPLLGRALTQSDTPADVKRALLVDVVKGRFADPTLDVILAAAAATNKSSDYVDVLADALAEVVFRRAEAADALASLEQNLFSLSQAIVTNDDLRDALSNPGTSDDAKLAILADLLKNSDAGLQELASTALVLAHGREVDEVLSAWADDVAARRGLVVAEVRSAVELDDDRKARLLSAVGESLGKTIQGRFLVDPSIIGSVIIRIGDEVFDGSVRHRLEQARVALVGAS